MKTTAKITLATTIAIVIGVAASLGFYITKNYLKKREIQPKKTEQILFPNTKRQKKHTTK